MARIKLFLLLPETNPSNQWMRSADQYIQAEAFNDLMATLMQKIDKISIENYDGFHDSLNIKNFITQYDLLEEHYPPFSKRRLRSLIQKNAFQDWRENIIHSHNKTYEIYNQPISDHTFCEMAERTMQQQDENHSLLNHDACTINGTFRIIVEEHAEIQISNLSDEANLVEWFSKNRIPPRQFRPNPKHGNKERKVGGKDISPLLCTSEKAQELLNTAIGNREKELFNLDTNHDQIIVFKHEGPTPENIYHGYHVPKDSKDVPDVIKKELIQ